jgi:uncharacterized protein YdhG (YjbR/CyaY superfamily)
MPDTSEEAFLSLLDATPEPHRQALLTVVESVMSSFPELERVIAWNKVHFRVGSDYVLGVDVLKHALWLHPFSEVVLADFTERLTGYHVTKRSFQLPLTLDGDLDLLRDIVKGRLAELQ